MNEVLEKELVRLIKSVEKPMSQGLDFAVEQAPEVIQQLLTWNFIESLAAFCLLSVLSVACLIGFIYHMRYLIKTGGEEIFVVLWMFPAVLLPAGLWQNLAWLKIWIAPKLYLLEYAAKLLD